MKAEQEWIKQIGSTGNDDALVVVADDLGSLYIIGNTNEQMPGTDTGNQGDQDIWLAKYDAGSSTRIWIQQLGSTQRDTGRAIALDNADGLYVAGGTKGQLPGSAIGNQGSFDAWIAKYNAISGQKLWFFQIGSSQSESITGIVADSNGGIYVSGQTARDTAGNFDAWVAKYEGSSGTAVWTTQVEEDSPTFSTDIAIDAKGDIYVVGSIGERIPEASPNEQNKRDVWLAKYEGATGKKLWFTQFGSTRAEMSGQITTDHNDGLYITGSTNGSIPGEGTTQQANFDTWLAKYDQNFGTRLWSTQIGSSQDDFGYGLDTDNSGGVYVTGKTDWVMPGLTPINRGKSDAWLAKYDANIGTQLWSKQLGSSQRDRATGVTTDVTGNVYIVGRTEGDLAKTTSDMVNNFDAWIAKYKQVPENFEDIASMLKMQLHTK